MKTLHVVLDVAILSAALFLFLPMTLKARTYSTFEPFVLWMFALSVLVVFACLCAFAAIGMSI